MFPCEEFVISDIIANSCEKTHLIIKKEFCKCIIKMCIQIFPKIFIEFI